MANESSKQGSGTVGLPPGARIGKYEVKERLAIGGQAVIYKCYDSLLDRFVAIKQVSSHLAEDPKFLERFRKEAQILARLGARQPAIVSIYELLEDERGLFIIMEHVEGNTLETVMQQNPQPVEPKAALQIIWRLAAALHDVHSAGIIHRDIKPGNIMIGEGLRPKITDFGVAASLTGQTSMLLGTTRYMAPELLSGQHFDGRADIYSLGFIAYEMLVGRAKFNEIFADIMRDKHSEALRWMKWHSNQAVQAPALGEVNPAVPRALSDIVAKMMAKDPAARYESMEALGRAIKAGFSPRAKTGAAPEGRKHRRRRHEAAAVAAVAHPLGVDEGDELDIGGPATAMIPKKQLSRRTKIVLAATAAGIGVVVLVAILISGSLKSSELSKERRAVLASANDNYFKKGNYDQSLKDYQALLGERFAGSDEAGVASVMVLLSEAQLAIQDQEWKLAAEKEDAARARRDQLNRVAKGALLDWTRKVEEDLQSFSRYRTTMQDYRKSMTLAEDAFKAERYDDARKIVTDALKRVDLKDEQVRELRAFQTRLGLADFKASIDKLLKKGQEASALRDFAAAQKCYEDAITLLAGDAGKLLSKEDRAALQNSIEEKAKQLEGDRQMANALADLAAAGNVGDLKGMKKALEDALRIKPQEDLSQQLQQVQSQIALGEAQEYERARKWTQAREQYVESLKFKENAEAREGLDRVAGMEQRSVKLDAALAAYDAGNFAEALKLYEDAFAGSPVDDQVIKDRISECRYRSGLDEADKLRDAGKFTEALEAYEKLRAIKPDASGVIDDREARMKYDQDYEALMAEGNKAFAAGQWDKAIEQFSLALKKKDTAEGASRLKYTKYMQSYSKGKERMDAADYPSAASYFKIALQYAGDEEKKQLEELIKQVEAKRKE